MPETIGQHLHRIRTERKLTLEQVAHATHIRIHYLRALEEDLLTELPSEAQGRGFVRLYAGYLHLPVQPILDAWPNQFIQETPPPVESPAPTPPSAIVQENPPPLVPQTIEAPSPDPEVAQRALEVPAASEPVPSTPLARPVQAEFSPPDSLEKFKSVGTALRQRREALNLSLADIENHTHIRRFYLEAIEAGETANLPSPAQGRGMLKNYAQFLNMNVEAVLLEYAEGLQARRLEKLQPEKPAAPAARPFIPPLPAAVRKWITPDMLVGVSAILLLIAIIVWGISQVTANRQVADSQATAPAVADILLNDTNAELTITPTLPPQATLRSPEQNAGGPVVNENVPPPADDNAVPVLGTEPVQLYLVASQRAWVRVTADGEVKFEGRVIPGNAYPFSAAEQIDLLVGNAAAIKVYFNQEELGTLGEVGEVLNLTFTATSMIVPTPLVQPTPTMTPAPPTATPQPSPAAVLPTPTVTPFIP